MKMHMKFYPPLFIVLLSMIAGGANAQEWQHITSTPNGLPDNKVKGISISSAGDKYILTGKGIVKYSASLVWSTIPKPPDTYSIIHVDKNGTLWSAGHYIDSFNRFHGGLYKYGIGNWVIIDSTIAVSKICSDTNNVLWMEPAFTYDGLKLNRIMGPYGNTITFSDVFIDKNNNKYFNTYGNGILKLNNLRWDSINIKSCSQATMLDMAVDKERKLWVCGYNAIVKADTSSCKFYTSANTNLPASYGIGRIVIDNNNIKWLNMVSSGIDKIIAFGDSTVLKTLDTSNSPLPKTITTFEIDNEGKLWIASDTGLFIYAPNIAGVLNKNNSKQKKNDEVRLDKNIIMDHTFKNSCMTGDYYNSLGQIIKKNIQTEKRKKIGNGFYLIKKE